MTTKKPVKKTKVCLNCQGTGIVNEENTCPKCDGAGRV